MTREVEVTSFWPAHLWLARVALEQNDTLTAVAEMELARDVAPDEPAVRMEAGRILLALGRAADAAEEFRAASRLAPRFAAPLFELGRALEAEARAADAAEAYRAYMELAPARAANREAARARLAALEPTVGTP